LGSRDRVTRKKSTNNPSKHIRRPEKSKEKKNLEDVRKEWTNVLERPGKKRKENEISKKKEEKMGKGGNKGGIRAIK